MHNGYSRLVSLAAWSAMVVASLLMLIKLVAWWHTSSVSLLASLIDSLLDMGASTLNLVIVRYSLQPADHEHSFGHGKAESLAALAQSTFISGSACFLLLNGVERLFRPGPLTDPEYGIMVSLLAILVTLLLVLFQRKVIHITHSQAIAADSLHYQSDLFMNMAIVVALGISWAGWPAADALFAIGIGFYILISALNIAYTAVQSLLDRQLPDKELAQIREQALGVGQVKGVHRLRTRQSGPVRFIQLHLELADDLLLIDAHHIADEVEQRLLACFPGSDILIHQDPVSVTPTTDKAPVTDTAPRGSPER